MGTGVCLFLAGKMGFHALGLGFISNKTIENGIGIKMWDGICAFGHWDLVNILAGKWNPPSGPSNWCGLQHALDIYRAISYDIYRTISPASFYLMKIAKEVEVFLFACTCLQSDNVIRK